jgi:spermidine synthase
LGSLVTGFCLFEIWDVHGVSVLLALLGIAMAAAVLPSAGFGPALRRAGAAALFLGACLPAFSGDVLFDFFYERLFFKFSYVEGTRFARTLTNRSGVINVSKEGKLYGGGEYDGVYSTDLMNDRNMIARAYAVTAFHPSPEEVLFIGLGSGSWLKVVAANPAVKSITVIEINPGYLELVAEYPEVSSVLDDPRITFVVDDGRRWLRRNPDRMFDLVVCNTTFNWRMNVTNLLSAEFLEIVREHLRPGGIHYYNTTGSPRVLRTGATVFPYALRVINFLAVSDSLFVFDTARWRKALEEYTIDGRKAVPYKGKEREEVLRGFIGSFLASLEGRQSILARTGGVKLVTDDNMGTEWEH